MNQPARNRGTPVTCRTVLPAKQIILRASKHGCPRRHQLSDLGIIKIAQVYVFILVLGTVYQHNSVYHLFVHQSISTIYHLSLWVYTFLNMKYMISSLSVYQFIHIYSTKVIITSAG